MIIYILIENRVHVGLTGLVETFTLYNTCKGCGLVDTSFIHFKNVNF